jgi:hypothetical protein
MIIALYRLNDSIGYCDVDVFSVEVLVESLRECGRWARNAGREKGGLFMP